jgi:hypothetical protein
MKKGVSRKEMLNETSNISEELSTKAQASAGFTSESDFFKSSITTARRYNGTITTARILGNEKPQEGSGENA